MPRKSPRPAPVFSDAETDAIADEAFPDPATPSGRILATLIGAHVPGTPATWATADLYRSAGLASETAETAIADLQARRILDVQATPGSASRRLTVLLAPPLDEYGVVPSWGQSPEADQARPTRHPVTMPRFPVHHPNGRSSGPARPGGSGRLVARHAWLTMVPTGSPVPRKPRLPGSSSSGWRGSWSNVTSGAGAPCLPRTGRGHSNGRCGRLNVAPKRSRPG